MQEYSGRRSDYNEETEYSGEYSREAATHDAVAHDAEDVDENTPLERLDVQLGQKIGELKGQPRNGKKKTRSGDAASYKAEEDPRSDPREVLAQLRQNAKQNPDSARHLAELAEGYAGADLPQKALQQYQRALEAQRENGEPEMPDAHLGIGDLCRTFAMSAVAVRSYERAVRLRPKRPFYRWKLAVALVAMGLYDKAVEQLEKSVELAPKDAYYRFHLADVFLLMGRDDEAIDHLQTVVELAPRDDYYRLRLGAALLRSERAAEAVPHFERVVKMKPQSASYHTLLSYAYARNNQEPAIAVDVNMLELSAYDEDFVRRFQRMAEPVARV